MKRTNITLMPLVAVLLATATWSISSNARAIVQEEAGESEIPVEAAACRASLSPDFVPVSDAAVVIAVVLPGGFGEVTEIRTEEGSGISVLDFAAGESEAGDLTTRLDVAAAEPGSWWLELESVDATCTALLTIGEAKYGG